MFDPQVRKPALRDCNPTPVGDDGKEIEMTTLTKTPERVSSNTLAFAFSALIGLGIIIFAGHIQAATLHDAAHDMRHTTGFPCH